MLFNRGICRRLLLGGRSAAVMPINRPEVVDDRDSSMVGINAHLINGAYNMARERGPDTLRAQRHSQARILNNRIFFSSQFTNNPVRVEGK